MDGYIEKIIVFLINISGLWLAYWVYFANKRAELNQWFAIMTFFVIMWVDWAFLGYGAEDMNFALACYRLNFTFVALFVVSFYYFYVIHFFEEKGKYLILGKIVAFVGIIIAALSLYTDLIINDTFPGNWGAEIVFGKGNTLFNLYAVLVACIIVYYTLRRYIKFSKKQKLKLQYLSIGIFFFILFNVVFNIIFPQFFGTMEYARFGDYSAIVLLAFIAYAVTKNNLMGVKAFLAQVIIIIMSSVLAVDILFLSDNFTMRILKSAILVTFLYFSQELIRNMKNEKDAAEKIRKMNLSLAERNTDLNTLLSLSDKVSQNLDSRKISQDIVDNIPKSLEYLGYTIGIVILYDKEKNCAYVYAVTNSPLIKRIEKNTGISFIKFKENLSKNDDFVIKTIKEGKTYTSDRIQDFFGNFMDITKSGEVQNIIKIKSLISIPLFSTGRVVGAIVFLNKRNLDCVTGRSKEIIRAFASHVGSAIENAQLYEKTNLQMKELSVLNINLQKANTRLEELLEMKSEFLHIASHQLRTPLTAMRGMISMWVQGDFDSMPESQRREMLQRIYISTERLNNITNSMLDALELQGGALKFEFKKVSVIEMIKDTIATLQVDYEKKGLYLKFIGADKNIPKIEAEPNYLAQVFMNLIDNACKYTKEGGTQIEVFDSGKYVDVYVKDTGIGMEEKEIKSAFDKFTRGKNAMKENAYGSGLGLFIVKKILDEHNGKIEVSSDGLGEGTTFKVSLPIKQ